MNRSNDLNDLAREFFQRISAQSYASCRWYRLSFVVLHTFQSSRMLVELSSWSVLKERLLEAGLKALHSICLLKLNETMCMAQNPGYLKTCSKPAMQILRRVVLFLYPTDMSDGHTRPPSLFALSQPQEMSSAIFSLFKTSPNLSVKLLEASSSAVTCSTIRK